MCTHSAAPATRSIRVTRCVSTPRDKLIITIHDLSLPPSAVASPQKSGAITIKRPSPLTPLTHNSLLHSSVSFSAPTAFLIFQFNTSLPCPLPSHPFHSSYFSFSRTIIPQRRGVIPTLKCTPNIFNSRRKRVVAFETCRLSFVPPSLSHSICLICGHS